jgi:hypothetical protein
MGKYLKSLSFGFFGRFEGHVSMLSGKKMHDESHGMANFLGILEVESSIQKTN